MASLLLKSLLYLLLFLCLFVLNTSSQGTGADCPNVSGAELFGDSELTLPCSFKDRSHCYYRCNWSPNFAKWDYFPRLWCNNGHWQLSQAVESLHNKCTDLSKMYTKRAGNCPKNSISCPECQRSAPTVEDCARYCEDKGVFCAGFTFVFRNAYQTSNGVECLLKSKGCSEAALVRGTENIFFEKIPEFERAQMLTTLPSTTSSATQSTTTTVSSTKSATASTKSSSATTMKLSSSKGTTTSTALLSKTPNSEERSTELEPTDGDTKGAGSATHKPGSNTNSGASNSVQSTDNGGMDPRLVWIIVISAATVTFIIIFILVSVICYSVRLKSKSDEYATSRSTLNSLENRHRTQSYSHGGFIPAYGDDKVTMSHAEMNSVFASRGFDNVSFADNEEYHTTLDMPSR